MRILLTSNASYSPPKGGSTRSNLLWLAHLVKSGHTCQIVCPTVDATVPDTEALDAHGISIFSVRDLSRHTAVLRDRIRAFNPDWALVSSEDVTHMLLREVHKAAAGRVVYLAHTPQFFPFGPASWNQDPEAAEIVRSAAGIVAIGKHMADYIQRHLGRTAVVIHPPMYGEPPYPQFGSSDSGWILMINPSVVKGISIFLALADQFPEYTFAGLTGWATTAEDRRKMAARSNVRVLETVPRIDSVLSASRLLLMPSLWYEGFGLIAMESMLRGLPVIASDSGGLVEAKQNTGYVVPVRAIERFEAAFDETNMPRASEPPQDIEPWIAALRELLTDRSAYEREAARARTAAIDFVSKLDAADFEKFLLSLPAPQSSASALADSTAEHRPQDLTPAKRALLLKKLRERANH